jgi:glucose-6-phosphate 1-dehydrogenase
MTAHVEAAPKPEQKPVIEKAPPCAFVVFGASGDLTRRKLIPALYKLAAKGFLNEHFAMIGVARREWTDEQFRAEMQAGVKEFAARDGGMDENVWRRFGACLHYVTGEFENPVTYDTLNRKIDAIDKERQLGGDRLYYLATPPNEFPVILHRLKQAGMIHAVTEPGWTRVIVEKPFGRDLDSAQALNTLIAHVLDESQIFRIDHYLGKETVQNILVFRFANNIFEPLWNRNYVDHVQITAAESIGVGTRGKFYDQNGVLRDVVQNHILELLSLTAMEPPTTSSADDIRNEKMKVLHALRKPWADTIANDLVLGQYKGYRDEPDVAKDSVTPTYACMRVFVDNWRWQGVPFYIRAGKKLAKRCTEISLHMRQIPLCLFGRDDVCARIDPNVLTLRIQPDEGISLSFASKIPGYDLQVGTVKMDMTYVETFGGEPPEAYERLLLDAMRGDATLFSRRDAVEASWEWITPILQWVDKHPPKDFPNYEPGSWGPDRCHDIMRREGRAWRTL